MMYLLPNGSFRPNQAQYGAIVTPDSDSPMPLVRDGYKWAGDNAVFSGKFTDERFDNFMDKMLPYRKTCLFMVAPDVVADAKGTMERYIQYAPVIRRAGYPVAWVAQDGSEMQPVPPSCDCVFIGGSTDWKMSRHADKVIKRAQWADKWVHIGRVNSAKRYRHFLLTGADSCDGTFICFGPDKNMPQLMSWVAQAALFHLEEQC